MNSIFLRQFRQRHLLTDRFKRNLAFEFPRPPLPEHREQSWRGQFCSPASQQLHRLHQMGIKLSIDDYGTGFSTLDYLKRCPTEEVKIERSFVDALCNSRSDLVMVNSTIELAHSLGRLVVAEGVENNATLDMLTKMKCDYVQGYLITKPMGFDKLQRFLMAHRHHDQTQPYRI